MLEFEKMILEEQRHVIDWFVLEGASIDEESYSELQELNNLELHDIPYYIGPATCDEGLEIFIDDDHVEEIVTPSAHHNLEIAALVGLGLPFEAETVESMIRHLQPTESERFDSFTSPGIQKECHPLSIEVTTAEDDVSVWVTQRLRVGDNELPTYHSTLRRFVALVSSVNEILEPSS